MSIINPKENPITILKSKEIFDYSKNILVFSKKTPLLPRRRKIKELIIKKDLKIQNHNKLYMKINNILNNFQDERQKNRNYIKLTDDLDQHSKNLEKQDENKNLTDFFSVVNYNFPKTNSNSYSTLNRRAKVFTPNYNFSLDSKHSIRRPLLLPPPNPVLVKEKIYIDIEINKISDILQLCKDYPLKFGVEYNIDMEAIHRIESPLKQLNNMIGMKKLKEAIVDQILFFIQKLHYNEQTKESDFMHTVIYGPPGTGKTEVAKIMGSIFSRLNVLSRRKFKKVTRADLIAGYLGQTAIKTRDVIKESLGGVLFIDEAYALGNSEKRDSFAKECIDTLCEGLSDHKNNLMVIIAGYEKELKDCFFNYNSGLDSRFTWRFHINDYNAEELKQIFEKKVTDANWKLKNDIKISWFEKNKEYFKFFGRDMETLFAKTKIAHARRVFCKKKEEKTILIKKDLEKGLKMFLENDEVQKRKNSEFVSQLYI